MVDALTARPNGAEAWRAPKPVVRRLSSSTIHHVENPNGTMSSVRRRFEPDASGEMRLVSEIVRPHAEFLTGVQGLDSGTPHIGPENFHQTPQIPIVEFSTPPGEVRI